MALKLDQIICKDSIKWLKKLDAQSVDLAFADPPFNIGYQYDVYDDRRGVDDYLEWSREWITGIARILKPDGTFWLAIGDEFAAELKTLCTRDIGLHCRSWVVWFYTFGVHCTQKFTRSHAHLFHFVKDPKKFTFNSLEIRVPSARQLVYGDKRANPDGRMPDDTWMMAPVLPPDVPTRDGFVLRPQDIPERFVPHSDTWFYSRVAGTFKERGGWHGCQMPEQLLGRIIRACSNEGDLILDPFAGSGTTPAVAKKLNRHYLACELSEEYARNVKKRLANIKPGDPLDGPENASLSAPSTMAGRRLKRKGPPAQRRVSHNPTDTKKSVPPRQSANGELAKAIAEAFRTAHEGYSADRVLADPALNERFLDGCHLLGIPGEAKDWNRFLLGVRKRGRLGAIDTTRRTVVLRSQMEPYGFASEIACRRIKDENSCTLDDILCDPRLASQLDKLAKKIAPGFQSFDYRWAALGIRKDARKRKGLLAQLNTSWARRTFRLLEMRGLANTPAHYLISTGERAFFVGYAASLCDCPLFNPDRLISALETIDQSSAREQDIEIRTRKFEPGKIGRGQDGSTRTARQAAQREKLVAHYEPVANILSPQTAA
ncbi:MAG: site-specific DNA-methyltransferase [Planctomycetes bacterium]|nr:site-specific DNA-methyltransferase [Planctomycetota bacterium]